MSDLAPMSPAVGLPAPDFELRDQHGVPHRLSGLRGASRVALVFFPLAFTPICSGELADARAAAEVLRAADVRVWAISCDPAASLRAFADAEGFDLPLLSDFWPHGQVARDYGVFLEDRGFATRGTFLIDRDGLVRWSVVTSPGEARDMGGLVAAATAP